MSSDEFEDRLRARLADLADHEDDWDDPAPRARELAAAGIAPDDDPAVVAPTPLPSRRRWLPGLAVAAVLLAFVVAAGFGLREVVRGGGSSSAGSAADAGGFEVGSEAPPSPDADATAGSGSGSAGSCVAGTPGSCDDVAGCALSGAATSNGPLASIATIRPSGVTGSRTTSGGTVAIPYQLTFGSTGGSAQVRPARAVWVADGQLCGTTGSAESNAIQVVPVAPGPGISGTATFTAVDSDGRPLPAGEYRAAVVIRYESGGSAMSQLVSTPVTVVVS